MRQLRGVGLLALGLCFAGAARAQGPFIDWPSAIKPGAVVAVGGVSQEFTYTSGLGGVTSVAPPSMNMAVTLTETLNDAGEPVSLVIQNANRSVGFHKANGDTITALRSGTLLYARASDWTRQALVADPTVMGWRHQTFGVWQGGLGMPNGSMGAASVGAITPGASVPQTGYAVFAGLMGGIYNDAAGQDHVISAQMGLQVDFAAHRADFWTRQTTDQQGRHYEDLNIDGVFVSLPNHPGLFGSLTTARLAGASSAQFYGPAATEVGGVFTLTPVSGQGLERLAGAFGGRMGLTPVWPWETLPPDSGFTSWSDKLKPGATVAAQGKMQEIHVSYSPRYSTAPTAPGDTTYTQTYSAGGVITDIKIEGPNFTLSYAAARGDTIGALAGDPRFVVAVDKDRRHQALAADPVRLGWDYQSFGFWEIDPDFAQGRMGVASIGAATPAAAVPTSGTATFRGLAGGVYVSEGLPIDVPVAADVRLDVDFAAKRAALSSGAFAVIPGTMYPGAGTDLSGTAVSGNLFYAAGTNQMTGTLVTANGRLTGTATARFFGPAAQEIGGTFFLGTLDGAKTERLGAAFGAKR